jgi:hypothetical protein
VKDPGRLLTSPRDETVDDRKAKFEALNEFVALRHGWLVSVPGDRDMRLQVLPGSGLPEQLAAMGYIVEWTGETQRILPHAIRQKFMVRSDGELEPFTEGSSKPVTVHVTHAGIAVVEQYDLRLP